MEKTFSYPIGPEAAGISIKSFLLGKHYPRGFLPQLKQADRITVNGIIAKVSSKLNEGDLLEVKITDDANENIVPTAIPLDVIYEDDDIIVINKQANLPVHPSKGNFTKTLANAVAYHYPGMNFHCINRLDRDTTGLTILARHRLSAIILSEMVRERKITREYLAIVAGRLEGQRTIGAPIARRGSSVYREVSPEGKRAVTHYEAIGYNPVTDITAVRLILETGVTHQIRVHMKYLGHPLVGDTLYNPENRQLERQGLHAVRLSFKQPLTGNPLILQAPLPEDMAALLQFSSRNKYDKIEKEIKEVKHVKQE